MILSHFKWTIEYAHLSTFNQSSLLNCDVNFSKDILEKDLNRLLFRPFLLLSSLLFYHSQRCTSFQLEHLINSCFISFDSWFIRSVECIQNKRFTHHSWIMWIVRVFCWLHTTCFLSISVSKMSPKLFANSFNFFRSHWFVNIVLFFVTTLLFIRLNGSQLD